MMNDEWQMKNDPPKAERYFIDLKKYKRRSEATATIRHSSIFN